MFINPMTHFLNFFKDLTKAKDLLEQYLPENIKSICNVNTVKLEPGSFIDKNLKKYFSDIIYSVRIRNRKAYVYTLVEHLTTPNRLIPYKLLRYQVGIMQQHLDKKHKTLPLIVPILYYRGKVSPYPYSLNIYDCYEEEDRELAKELLLHPVLVDLNRIPDEELRTHKSIALFEILQKNIHRKDAMELIPDICVNEYDHNDEEFGGVVGYIIEKGQSKCMELFLSTLMTSLPNRREEIMTLAQQLEQKGLQQGRQELASEIARKMQARGVEPEFIKEMTGLSDEELVILEA